MTEKLYYQDVYKKEFSATVVSAGQEADVLILCLDRTAFYPEGGGQGADTGTLFTEDGTEFAVFDVQEENDEILHFVKAEESGISAGMKVTGKIDWDRRFDHMQQHSGEHIVSGMICERFHCDNVGFHMGADLVVIDYNAVITYEQALEIEAKANAYLWEDHPFEELWPSEEKLNDLSFRSKKEIAGTPRITRFSGADTCACCGTHVTSSAQVGLVKILSAKKFHDGTRLELLCGKRAMDYLNINQSANKEVAVLMSTSEENTPDRVRRLLKENIQLKADAAEIADRFLTMWAKQYTDVKNPLVIDDKLTAAQGRTLADLIAECAAGNIAVFTKTGTGYQYAVINRTEDITDFIKDMNAALQGRGGGRNGFAQGSVQAGRKEIEAYFK